MLLCVCGSLSALSPAACGPLVGRGAAGRAARRLARRARLPELPLLPATPRRRAVSAARRRAARFGAQSLWLQSSLSASDAATHLVNRLFLPIAMAAASFRARERQRSGAGAT